MTEPTIRYRHRTAEVEAVQWTGSNAEVLSAFCGPDFDEIELDDRTEDPDESAAVREGKHGTWRGLRPGDWVVKLDGGLYEFAAADFAEQYEPAVPAPASDGAAAPTDWIDGHPQLEAIAAAVWEKCGRSDSGTCVEDDPRNIAVAAYAAAFEAALPSQTGPKADSKAAADQAAPSFAFVVWLDATDGTVPTHDGIQWPDGWATIRHRHYGHTTTHHTPQAAAHAAHGKQARIVWPAPAARAAVRADAPVRQRADCTELEWAVQERARFERLYTRETVRADLAEQRADTAARDADIYQQRLERLSDGYTEQRKRAEAMERAMESTAADASAHRFCHMQLMAQCQRAERAEAEAERLRASWSATCICGHPEAQHFEDACLVCDCGDYLSPAAAREVIASLQEAARRAPDRAAEFTAADLVAALRGAGAERDKIEAQAPTVTLPYTHTDDDSDQLIIGVVNASTHDGDVPQVFICAREFSDDAKEETTVYVRPEFVERAVAAMRAARIEADRMAAAVQQQPKEA